MDKMDLPEKEWRRRLSPDRCCINSAALDFDGAESDSDK
jgi:hypothetical protein